MKRIILWLTIVFLSFWIISPLFLELFELEFKERSIEQSFEDIRFWGILVCIPLTLFWAIKTTDKIGEILLKILGTVGITVLIFFFIAISVLSGFCTWSDGEILLTNKKNEKIKIVKRNYGCGAVDSGLPIVRDFKIKEVGKIFIKSREINIEEINDSEWIKNEK